MREVVNATPVVKNLILVLRIGPFDIDPATLAGFVCNDEIKTALAKSGAMTFATFWWEWAFH